MLRGFFVIFLLCAIADPRGLWISWAEEHSPRRRRFSPIWCASRRFVHKHRSIFLQTDADHVFQSRARCRLAMRCQSLCQLSNQKPTWVPWSHPRPDFGGGTDYYNTGKMGDHWGTRHSGSGHARVDGARTTTIQHHLRDVSRRYRSR